MNNIKHHEFAAVQSSGVCTNPAVGDRLFIYLNNPLEDPSAEAVEDHLLGCRHCRNILLKMLSLQKEARRASNARGHDDGSASNDAKVARLADFDKEWP
ncbi:MAG TPA: zf-HC2 domain-containing protein [Pyrinomonadaceae bacterium]|nr:zf-HC2 domain-containing protein [Pyrinomonadaceae bacterium]